MSGPARPLTARGLENLVAFTRLLGYVRYFHSRHPVEAADWGGLARAGVQVAEEAAGPEELARALEGFFRPVAPAVRVFPAGRRPAARGEPLVAGLGGGVSAMVPLALHGEEEGTLPALAPEVRPAAPAKPAGFLPSGNDRATRLADVALAWNVFQHFYPYFDVVQADWPAELRRALSCAAMDEDERAFLDTLRRLVAALRDGHGSVYHASDSRTHQLPLLWDWVEGQLAVTRVAADKAEGLRPGDVILAVEGRPAREALAAAEELISGATPQWRRWRALHHLAAGRRGEPVRLAGRHCDGEPFAVTLARTVPAHGPASLKEARPEKIAEVQPGIFYLDAERIDDEDFEGALDRLAGAKGIVFDFRGYPAELSPIFIAHLIDQPVTSPRWNVPLVIGPDREEIEWDFSNWPVEPREPRLAARLACLADGRALSYAETLLGIVEHYRLAEIVGGPTAGTNGNIDLFSLPGGYQVIWTAMQVLKHDGSRHHGVGIQPTVPVTRTLQGVAEGRDELLEKAVEAVSRPRRD